ncbi:UDP-Glycosyltransferase superfamily protein [Actinidia rufa]|uniref:UDP-Glycosyltransferase superfamily protein n=1 Tax=Actinidia rufa TaxID=165716 RepID=A0A7J0DZN5_9ERIC|nr:UDP-Glycosyltransferase superfamily protein [Actinidia rufa]
MGDGVLTRVVNLNMGMDLTKVVNGSSESFTTFVISVISMLEATNGSGECDRQPWVVDDCGGYSSEAWAYILALHANTNNPSFRLVIDQHGDLENVEFWEGLSQEMKKLAFELYQTQCAVEETIVICHSEPGAWNPPLFQTLPCPPTGYGHFRFVIGRPMFETNRLNPEHVRRCNQMDSIWVPTQFHVSTFVQSGVDSSKVVKIVQPVDVKFFDPVKGWDVLLKAYLKEFSEGDGVALYLLTNPYHSDRDFGNKIVEFVEDSDLVKPAGGWAWVYVIDSHIPQVDLPRLYKAADAFALPSRGEGWGRPLVEAMAMSLPVITTNWSGPTEYITEINSYPLPVDVMSEVTEGPFKGHLWAEPSADKLQGLMRRVISDPEEAKAKGRRAREDMINRFSPKIVAGIVTDYLLEILNRTD